MENLSCFILLPITPPASLLAPHRCQQLRDFTHPPTSGIHFTRQLASGRDETAHKTSVLPRNHAEDDLYLELQLQSFVGQFICVALSPTTYIQLLEDSLTGS